ncbi:MAG TPA: hypothetical protein DD417_04850 [Elusimicrobia bacterium]|nr:hypothetical protein [Elusimicrobiota bacterium]
MGWILSRSEARGWDRKDFLACIEAPETAARLRADIKLGYGLRIPGTPTVFLNGRELLQWSDAAFVRRVVRMEIGKNAGGHSDRRAP